MTTVSTTTSEVVRDYQTPPSQFDAECALLAMLVLNQSSTQRAARQDVQIDYQKLDELKAQLAAAAQQAQQASDDSGFWGFISDVFGSDVAEVAGAVAAAAAVVATGGAATPLLLVVMSTALETGAKVGAELGLDPKICMAIAIAGAAIGLCAGNGAGELGKAAKAAQTVERVATTVQGSSIVVSGATGYVSGQYAADAADRQADAAWINGQQNAANLDIDDAIATLERALRAQDSMTGTVAQIQQDTARANSVLVGNV
ncbi:MAG TPA: hypothetical protein VGI10_29735 [Polyangiaceae bacterium]|jgi:hypothetical protein